MAGETDTVEDDFSASFAAISEADKKGEELKVADAPVVEQTAEQIEAERVTAETAAAAKAAEDAVAAANEGKTPEQIEAEAAAATEAATAAAAKKAEDDAAARAAQANENLAATVAKAIRQTDQEAAEAAAEAARNAPKKPEPMLNAAELAKVQAFEKEFPDIAEAQAIVRKAEYKQIVGHVLDEVRQYVGAQLTPLAASMANLLERTHVGDLQKEVPDYEKLDVPKLHAWVKTQPDYLQSAYDSVMRTGTTAQVKDLVVRFYADTGVKPAAAPAKTAEEVAAAAAQAAARTKVVAALAPVATKRTGVVAAATPTDFDGAFAAATRELAAQDNDRFSR